MTFFTNLSYKYKLLLTFIAFSLLILAIVGVSSVIVIEKNYSEKRMLRAEKIYQQKLQYFQDYIAKTESKLLAVRNSNSFKNYLYTPNTKNLQTVEDLFYTLAYSNPNIMQLRFIDSKGMERIRVDRNTSGSLPYLTPEDQLQNKQHRYYYQELSKLPDNKVWYSHIDLNIEHGEIEKPIKPVLRVGFSHYYHDDFQGVVIINIFMEDLLNSLVFSKEYDIFMIDNQDNILASTDHHHNWSQYVGHNGFKEKQFHFSNLALKPPFYINTLDFNNREGLKLVIKPKQTHLMTILTEEATPVLLILFFVAFLSIPLAYLFSEYPSKLEKEIEEHNKYLEMRVDKAIKSYQENEKILLHQSRLAQMGEMISMIAHQWRQPLSTITMALTGLIMKMERDESYSKSAIEKKLLSVQEKAQDLSNVLNDFRDFYSPKEVEDETSIDTLVESSLQIIKPQLTTKNIDVTTDLKSKEIFSAYGNHLKQVIIAILQNAQDAYEKNISENKRIEIQTYTKDNSHFIEISDHAGGIPEDIIEDIFTPYFSTKESKNGTGLGLYMSKLVIEKHCKGRIFVRNSNNGAVFTIIF